jgi:penicillin-binding protein 2
MGLERSADRQLRGQPGEKLIEADAAGKQVRLIAEKPAIEGDILRLNLDIELTRHIFQTLAARSQEKHTQGAVVVSRVGSNEILALVSWPGFDPNLFTQGQGEGSYRTVEQVLGDTTLLPLFNRAAAGVYPPASTYKLVTSIAGLETGQISGSTEVEDTGELVVGEFRFGTWNFDQRGQKEGNIGVVRALARSNDIFFYKVGEWVGIEQLRFWSESLGLGKRTGIELNSEATGLVPDPVEKERSTGERWFLGNTYHMAIGQGDLLASPLQVDRMTSGAISGLVCPARLISGDAREGCQEVGISQANRELVLEGMKQACAPGGTAFPFFQFEPKVACKTGTAQHGGEEAEPHAWITVVVPGMGTTELARFEAGWVITVLLEEAGEGSYEAGPVARSIAQYLVEKEGL